jgi:hypothetical protein
MNALTDKSGELAQDFLSARFTNSSEADNAIPAALGMQAVTVKAKV